MNELKPCPFCGGEAEVLESVLGVYMVICTDCYSHTNYYITKTRAIYLWNSGKEINPMF